MGHTFGSKLSSSQQKRNLISLTLCRIHKMNQTTCSGSLFPDLNSENFSTVKYHKIAVDCLSSFALKPWFSSLLNSLQQRQILNLEIVSTTSCFYLSLEVPFVQWNVAIRDFLKQTKSLLSPKQLFSFN